MKYIGAKDVVGGYVGAVPVQEGGSEYGVAKTVSSDTLGQWAFYSLPYVKADNVNYVELGTTSNLSAFVRPKNLSGTFSLEATMGTNTPSGLTGSVDAGNQAWGFGAMTEKIPVGSKFGQGKSNAGNYAFFDTQGIGDTSSKFSYAQNFYTTNSQSAGVHTFTHTAHQSNDIIRIKRTDTQWEIIRIRSGVEELLGTCPHVWTEDARVVVSMGDVTPTRYTDLKWTCQNTNLIAHQCDGLNFHDHVQMVSHNTNNHEDSYRNSYHRYNFSNSNGYAVYQTGQTKGDFSAAVEFKNWDPSTGSNTNQNPGWWQQFGFLFEEFPGSMTNAFVYQQSKKRVWVGVKYTGNNQTIGLYAADSQGSSRTQAEVTRFVPNNVIITIVRRSGIIKVYLGSEWGGDCLFDDVQSLLQSSPNQVSWRNDDALFEGPLLIGNGTNSAQSGTAVHEDMQITSDPRIVGTKSVTPKGCFTIREAFNKAKLNLWVPDGSSSASSFRLQSGGGWVYERDFQGYHYVKFINDISNDGTGDEQTTFSFASTSGGVVEWILIGAGGAGGHTDQGYNGGGGGSGALIWAKNFLMPATSSFTVKLGRGAGRQGNTSNNTAKNGGNSKFYWGAQTPNVSSWEAEGGGGGAGYHTAYVVGANGGSGGGSENILSSSDFQSNINGGIRSRTVGAQTFELYGGRGGASTTKRSGGGGGTFSDGGHSQNDNFDAQQSLFRKLTNSVIGQNGGTGLFLPEWCEALQVGAHGFLASGGNGATYDHNNESYASGDRSAGRHGGGLAGGNAGQEGLSGKSAGDGGGGTGNYSSVGSNKSGAGGPGAFLLRWRI